MSEAWQQRVIDEQRELDERRQKLDVFLSSDKYREMWRSGVDHEHAVQLRRQYDAMTEYSRILGIRRTFTKSDVMGTTAQEPE